MRSKAGFTLIEMMIVVLIIAIIAAFLLVSVLRAKMAANETSAINTIRTIRTNQALFQIRAVDDEDDDGIGEFGFLQELAGLVQVRDPDGTRLKPGELLSPTLAQINHAGEVQKNGYLFKMYLPARADFSVFATETQGAVAPIADQGGIDRCEHVWVCYAWPADVGRTGNRVFVIDSSNQLYQMRNGADSWKVYTGTTNGPDATAAFLLVGDSISYARPKTPSTDGNLWFPL